MGVGFRKSQSALAMQALVVCAAAMLLLWGLNRRYLWQDEAATAVLAERMLRFGRPLAYDGVNLITIDHTAAEDERDIDQRTRDPRAAVNYYVRRGDMKSDTTWIWQPWGQFVFAAVSLKLLGAATFAARLPFALAGIITTFLLFRFVLRYFANPWMALLASGFLIFNTYWILHSRQCRYYALSSLFLMLTLAAYFRWQTREHRGAVFFLIASWCWFQVDYGTVWPVLAVLLVDALIASRQKLWKPLLLFALLAATVAPFAYYYQLWGRLSTRAGTWHQRFALNFININEYVTPLLIVGMAFVLALRWPTLSAIHKRLVFVSSGIVIALLFWVPSVAPAPFLRYSIIAAPIGSFITAWVLMELGRKHRALTWIAAPVFLFTPWLSLPLHVLWPGNQRPASLFRPELAVLARNVFGHQPDSNRDVIVWLKHNAAPDDEILINYEDIPLMFYLPNPIRGGIAAFRVEDDAIRPPDFVVLRKSADFGHWDVYQRELKRYSWQPISLHAPDVVCANCPDPIAQEFEQPGYDPARASPIFFARRISDAGASRH